MYLEIIRLLADMKADWSPDKAPELSSVKSNDKYEGYVYMANAGNMFKFTDGPNWDLNWGDDGAMDHLSKMEPIYLPLIPDIIR